MRSAGILTAAVLAVAAASTPRAAEYDVAIVQSLTGQAAFIGVSVRDGMLMAIDEVNAKGLLGAGNSIRASVDDDAGDRGQTVTLVRRFAADRKVLLEAGPTTGAVSAQAAAAANDEKFPLYAVSNVPGVVAAGPWSFSLTEPPSVSIRYIADYALAKAKVKSCAIITILDNEAYIALAKGFQDIVAAGGVKIASYDGAKVTDSDFSALAAKVVQQKQDCVFVSAPATLAANIVVQLAQAGLDPSTKIFGHNSLAAPDFVKFGGKAVEGAFLIGDWKAGGSNAAGKAFADTYQKKFGRETDNWAPIGYSAIMVIVDALKRAGPAPTRESLRDALAKTKDVPVIIGNGKYSFDPTDRLARYGMNVLTVKNGEFVAAP